MSQLGPCDPDPVTTATESTLARIQRTPTYVIAREFDEMATALAEQAREIEGLKEELAAECKSHETAEGVERLTADQMRAERDTARGALAECEAELATLRGTAIP